MPKLTDKQQKALDLVMAGALSYKEIAKQCGWSPDYLYRLVEGKEAERSEAGKLFYETLQTLQKQRDKEIRDLVKDNKKKTHALINRWLSTQDKKKVDGKLMSTLVSVANALSKSTPNVEIGSFTYQKGLSPEDIYAEFKRLSGLASHGRAVQESSAAGTGEIPVAPRPRVAITQESEDSVLPAEPETGTVPPEFQPD